MTEAIDYVAEVIDSVEREFDEFFNEQMKESKGSIFNNSFQIFVYTALHDYITAEIMDEEGYQCLYKDKGSILSLLYDEYIHNENFHIEDDTDKVEFLDWYNKKFHRDILEGGTEIE